MIVACRYFPTLLIVLMAVFNDGAMIALSKDRVVASRTPNRWNLPSIFAQGMSGCTLHYLTVMKLDVMLRTIILKGHSFFVRQGPSYYMNIRNWHDSAAMLLHKGGPGCTALGRNSNKGVCLLQGSSMGCISPSPRGSCTLWPQRRTSSPTPSRCTA